jgi:hypothetical protein
MVVELVLDGLHGEAGSGWMERRSRSSYRSAPKALWKRWTTAVFGYEIAFARVAIHAAGELEDAHPGRVRLRQAVFIFSGRRKKSMVPSALL